MTSLISWAVEIGRARKEPDRAAEAAIGQQTVAGPADTVLRSVAPSVCHRTNFRILQNATNCVHTTAHFYESQRPVEACVLAPTTELLESPSDPLRTLTRSHLISILQQCREPVQVASLDARARSRAISRRSTA